MVVVTVALVGVVTVEGVCPLWKVAGPFSDNTLSAIEGLSREEGPGVVVGSSGAEKKEIFVHIYYRI